MGSFGNKHSVLPGFGPALGYTIFYLSIIVLIPLSALFFKTATLTWDQFLAAVTAPRVVASYRITFGSALFAAVVNAVFGVLTAWVLVRYRFPGRKLIDALVDLPFALPTAVAGITLASVYSPNGWLGRFLEPRGIKVAFTPLGIMVAMIFIGLPFVVRTVQPVLEDMEPELEEAAATLGASDLRIFRSVIFPTLFPAFLAGTSLAFARSLGEFGAVVFIAGNQPFRTEIVALLTFIRLEEYDYAAAAAIAVTMLALAFLMLLVVNAVQAWHQRSALGEG